MWVMMRIVQMREQECQRSKWGKDDDDNEVDHQAKERKRVMGKRMRSKACSPLLHYMVLLLEMTGQHLDPIQLPVGRITATAVPRA